MRQSDVAERSPDQAYDRLDGMLAHRYRAERRHGQNRDAVCRADMSDDGTPCGLQREVGYAYRQLPAAVKKHPAARRDQRTKVGWRFNQPVRDESHPPPDSGKLFSQPFGDLRHETFCQFRGRTRRGRQADGQRRLL